MISDKRGSNSTLFSTFIGSVINGGPRVDRVAAGELDAHPLAGLDDPPHRRVEPDVGERACAAIESISSRVPFSSFVADNAAII